jgi:hypothetical protein
VKELVSRKVDPAGLVDPARVLPALSTADHKTRRARVNSTGIALL